MEWVIIFSVIVIVAIVSVAVYVRREEQERLQSEQKKAAVIKRQLVSDVPVKYKPTKIIDVFISAIFRTGKWRPDFYDNCKTFGFDEIAGFELIENGEVIATTTTKTKGGISRALVGGALAGGVGALVGASTAKKKSHTTEQTVITSRCVRISLTNPNVNQIEINIPKHKEYYILTKEGKYTASFETIGKEIISMLESMVAAADKFELPKPAVKDNADQTIKQIREYKQLLDEGIITQEDFDAKKKQLLGI